MKLVFADTSYFIALLSENDAFHETAKSGGRDQLGRVVVTEYVLIEVGNSLSRSPVRPQFAPFVRQLLQAPEVQFVPATVRLFDLGL